MTARPLLAGGLLRQPDKRRAVLVPSRPSPIELLHTVTVAVITSTLRGALTEVELVQRLYRFAGRALSRSGLPSAAARPTADWPAGATQQRVNATPHSTVLARCRSIREIRPMPGASRSSARRASSRAARGASLHWPRRSLTAHCRPAEQACRWRRACAATRARPAARCRQWRSSQPVAMARASHTVSASS